jgi:hypothetical protein
MKGFVSHIPYAAIEPARVAVEPAIFHRSRLTTAFRAVLASPHLVLVGGPAAGASLLAWYDGPGGLECGRGDVTNITEPTGLRGGQVRPAVAERV